MKRVTTIQVKDDTKHKLDLLGSKGDSYDDIIRRLLKNYQNDTKLAKTPNLSEQL